MMRVWDKFGRRFRPSGFMVSVLLALSLPATGLAGDDPASENKLEYQQLKADLNRALARSGIPSFGPSNRSNGTTSKPAAHGAYDPHKTLSTAQHIKVALQHQAEGRLPLAIESLGNALRQHATDFRILAVRSGMYREAGNLSAALADINGAIRLAPDQAGLYVNRSALLSGFGRGEEALADLDKALEIDPDMLPAYFNRGSMHYQAERLQAALTDFDHCIAIDPHQAAPYFNRAAVHHLLGQTDDAIADMERFLQLADSESWRAQGSNLLEQWRVAAAASSGDVDQDS